jgi:flagellar motor switch/type III secretory pathway protein FliN
VRVLVPLVKVAAEDPPSLEGASLALATSDDGVRIQLEVDRELARTLVARIIGRPARLGDPRAPMAPELEGALLAIVTSVARRAHGSAAALVPSGAGAWRRNPGERHLEVHATVMIGDDAYAARAVVQLRKSFSAQPAAGPDDLASLGPLPISIPVVAAISWARSAEVYAMSPDDVWMPGSGWSIRRSHGALAGEVVLAPPAAGRGVGATVGETGDLVVRGVRPVPLDVGGAMTSEENRTATSDVVLDAPLVVRVELGTVTLTAQEWAALGDGDVIALGRRVSEPVVLRIAGVEVARGELVDIEGELGVRLRERVKFT